MSKDYKVRSLSRNQIHDHAIKLRIFLGIDKLFQFNIVRLLREKMIGRELNKIGTLRLNKIICYAAEASVEFSNGECILNVDDDLWDLAERGDSESIFKIIHELGHLMMHNFYAQNFSKPEEVKLNFLREDESAECQANTFAAYFMAPREYINYTESTFELNQSFNFPLKYA